jgi:hypothetical protein
MASASELQYFIDRQRILLEKERGAEIECSSSLLSNSVVGFGFRVDIYSNEHLSKADESVAQLSLL